MCVCVSDCVCVHVHVLACTCVCVQLTVSLGDLSTYLVLVFDGGDAFELLLLLSKRNVNTHIIHLYSQHKPSNQHPLQSKDIQMYVIISNLMGVWISD